MYEEKKRIAMQRIPHEIGTVTKVRRYQLCRLKSKRCFHIIVVHDAHQITTCTDKHTILCRIQRREPPKGAPISYTSASEKTILSLSIVRQNVRVEAMDNIWHIR